MSGKNILEMPFIGLGTFRSENGDECYNAVKIALETGYRHIDTAQAYQNEESVGKAIHDSNIKREEIFITTKLWPKNLGYDNAIKKLKDSLRLMNLEYIDLYLIHWPSHDFKVNVETWKAFIKLKEEGLVKHIGVSNFHRHYLDDIIRNTKVIPEFNQIELHPYLNQIPLIKYHNELGIKTISYGPFAKGRVFDDEALIELSKKYNKSIPNIIVKWGIQNNIYMIPKSVTKERIIQNFDIFDFELSKEDINLINSLNRGLRVYTDPDNNPFSS